MHSASNSAPSVPTTSIHISFGYDRISQRFYAFISHDSLTAHKLIRQHCINQLLKNTLVSTLNLSTCKTIPLERHTQTSMSEKIQHVRAAKNQPPLSAENLQKQVQKNLLLDFQTSEQILRQHIQATLLLAIDDLQINVRDITQMLYWGDGNLGETDGQKGPLFLMSPTLFAQTFVPLQLTSLASIHRILISGNQCNCDAMHPLYTKQREQEEWRKKWIPCSDPTPVCQYTDHFVAKNTGDKPIIAALLESWETTLTVTKPGALSHWLMRKRTTPFDEADQTILLALSAESSEGKENKEDNTVRAFVTASV